MFISCFYIIATTDQFVHNKLSILNDTILGSKPTYIEQNLARDYTQFYDTTKHGSPVNTGHHFTRFLKLKNYNPTQGELFIMVNKEQNKPGNWSPRGHYAPSKPQHSAMPRTATWDYSVEGRETLQTEVLPVASSQDLAPPTQPEDLNANESSNSRGKITPEREEMRSPSCNEEKLQERLEISTTLPDINAVVTA
ncbi:hypothetical protein EB796_023255 [Bugula neritina]|uniref:Uncharacterized protein n=1 Tax=Bugula neritina TaxID=10212 RepID=A0A7J7IX64_BUGNE|nr:hypothetical protein EB796_023255 [Bugula neritina]